MRDDAIALAVVDPSVGRDRDLAVRTGNGRLLVGPDNGILDPAWQAMNGVAQVVSITSEQDTLQPIAPSFHARDVLAPAAAHLAAGVPLEDLGEPVDPDTLARLSMPEPNIERGRIECERPASTDPSMSRSRRCPAPSSHRGCQPTPTSTPRGGG